MGVHQHAYENVGYVCVTVMFHLMLLILGTLSSQVTNSALIAISVAGVLMYRTMLACAINLLLLG